MFLCRVNKTIRKRLTAARTGWTSFSQFKTITRPFRGRVLCSKKRSPRNIVSRANFGEVLNDSRPPGNTSFFRFVSRRRAGTFARHPNRLFCPRARRSALRAALWYSRVFLMLLQRKLSSRASIVMVMMRVHIYNTRSLAAGRIVFKTAAFSSAPVRGPELRINVIKGDTSVACIGTNKTWKYGRTGFKTGSSVPRVWNRVVPAGEKYGAADRPNEFLVKKIFFQT